MPPVLEMKQRLPGQSLRLPLYIHLHPRRLQKRMPVWIKVSDIGPT